MEQLHKRFTSEQIQVLLQGYCSGLLFRNEVQQMLHIGQTRFFDLPRQYRQEPVTFSVSYSRATLPRPSATTKAAIQKTLLEEKQLVEDPYLPIANYNYSALRDRLAKVVIHVALDIIIQRAKSLGCYRPHRTRPMTAKC